jgi:hypothetical protein
MNKKVIKAKKLNLNSSTHYIILNETNPQHWECVNAYHGEWKDTLVGNTKPTDGPQDMTRATLN